MRYLQLDGLRIILLVITRPNSAFATIRDNDEKYIWWAVGGFILSSAVPMLFIFSLAPPLRYGDDLLLFIIESALAFGMLFLFFTVFVWLIGWAKRGNRYWKKTFSVLFYAWIAVSLPASILTPLLYASGLVIDKVEIESDLIIVGTFYFFSSAIWLIILTIKAIKIINKWYNDTWKAIIIAILGYISMGLFHALLDIIPIPK